MFSVSHARQAYLAAKPAARLRLVIERAHVLKPTALDYRLSPQVRFPSSLLDAVSAYFYLTEGTLRPPLVSFAKSRQRVVFPCRMQDSGEPNHS